MARSRTRAERTNERREDGRDGGKTAHLHLRGPPATNVREEKGKEREKEGRKAREEGEATGLRSNHRHHLFPPLLSFFPSACCARRRPPLVAPSHGMPSPPSPPGRDHRRDSELTRLLEKEKKPKNNAKVHY
jgi:hypothetical protein